MNTPHPPYASWSTVTPPALRIPPDATGRASARADFRRSAWELLGDFPARTAPQPIQALASEARDGYRVERFAFADGCGWTVPGVCYVPDGQGPFPAVLWNHWHGGNYDLGLGAVDRAVYTPEAPGPTLARRGYVVLAVEAAGFGQREGQGPDGTRGQSGETSIAKHALLHGRTMWGQIVHDDLCALDILAARPDVDAARIGTAGISLGCFRSLWAAALDERLRATVGICCLVRLQDLIAAGGLHLHGIYYYVPGMLRRFDIEAVLAAIAPRALLSLNGERDALAPLAGIRTAERLARPAWELDGRGNRLRIAIEPGVGHAWTPSMWAESLAWLDRHLA